MRVRNILRVLRFTVYGRPRPKGSTQSFLAPSGKIVTHDAAGIPGLTWEQGIASAALVARTEAGLAIVQRRPVGVKAVFFVPRNKGDYGTGRNSSVLKPSAPAFPARKPDVDKYLRRVLDALSGVVFADDGQVVDVRAAKRWGDPARAEISVWLVPSVAEDGQLDVEQLALSA